MCYVCVFRTKAAVAKLEAERQAIKEKEELERKRLEAEEQKV